MKSILTSLTGKLKSARSEAGSVSQRPPFHALPKLRVPVEVYVAVVDATSPLVTPVPTPVKLTFGSTVFSSVPLA